MPAFAFLQLGQTFHIIHPASRGETTSACHEGSAGPWLFDIGILVVHVRVL